MKPTKNRQFCIDCGKTKMLFETEQNALNFIKFNKDLILEESYKAPVRAYYCKTCGGWHVTSHEHVDYQTLTRGEQLIESNSILDCMGQLLNQMEICTNISDIQLLKNEFIDSARRVRQFKCYDPRIFNKLTGRFHRLFSSSGENLEKKICHIHITETFKQLKQVRNSGNVEACVPLLEKIYELIKEGESKNFISEDVQHYRTQLNRQISEVELMDANQKCEPLEQHIDNILCEFWDSLFNYHLKKCMVFLSEISDLVEQTDKLKIEPERKRNIKEKVLHAIESLEEKYRELDQIDTNESIEC